MNQQTGENTLVADHCLGKVPALPLQQSHEVARGIIGVHGRKILPVWRPAQAQREGHADKALLEGPFYTAREVCERGQITGQSTADQADMLRELGELQHARKGLKYLGYHDMRRTAGEEQVQTHSPQWHAVGDSKGVRASPYGVHVCSPDREYAMHAGEEARPANPVRLCHWSWQRGSALDGIL